MLGEDLDIGFNAEDAYAAYIIQAATVHHFIPEFSNARGATVDVVFDGPFMTEDAFLDAAAELRNNDLASGSWPSGNQSDAISNRKLPIWERLAETPLNGTERNLVVVLHASIEKLNGPRKIQLTEPVQLLSKVEEEAGASNNCLAAPTHHRVLGNLDFLLHLSTRNPLLGESSANQDTLSLEKFGSPPNYAKSTADCGNEASAARDVLEQRDDVAVARNAVDTILKFTKLAEEHVGEVATVYLDEEHGEEYIQFERR